jgi:hypothetical protein
MEPAVSSEPNPTEQRTPRFSVGQEVRFSFPARKPGEADEVRDGVIVGISNQVFGKCVLRWRVVVQGDGGAEEFLVPETRIEPKPIRQLPISPRSRWKAGDRVRVLDGSRKGQFAEVKGFDAYGHAVVAFPDGDSSPYLDFWLKAATDVPAGPGVADTLAGIAAWQREAPMDRDVLIHLKGHTVTATASLLAGSTEAFSGKFLADYTPQASIACMDAIVMQRSRVPIVFGARPEPPLGDGPYLAEED